MDLKLFYFHVTIYPANEYKFKVSNKQNRIIGEEKEWNLFLWFQTIFFIISFLIFPV